MHDAANALLNNPVFGLHDPTTQTPPLTARPGTLRDTGTTAGPAALDKSHAECDWQSVVIVVLALDMHDRNYGSPAASGGSWVEVIQSTVRAAPPRAAAMPPFPPSRLLITRHRARP